MSVCGIVCEYNPFHNGHAYQISKVKEICDSVVCVMSGDFVQRANSSVMDKCDRANIAIRSGADLVIELPFPFSSMGAQGFAHSAISIMVNSEICTHFAFGSECGDVEKLLRIANLTLSDSFEKECEKTLKENKNLGLARARSKAIGNALGEEFENISKNPNDILAVEYLRANILLGNKLSPVAIKRSVNRNEKNEEFASSSHIRELLQSKDFNGANKYVPYNLKDYNLNIDDEQFYKLIHINLCLAKPEDLKDILEVEGGAENAIVKAAKQSESFDQMCKKLASKTLTDAKIRRMLLFCAFGIKKEYGKALCEYTRVLAMNKNGQKVLSDTRKDRKIIVASRVCDISKSKSAKQQFDVSEAASEVLKKCRLK